MDLPNSKLVGHRGATGNVAEPPAAGSQYALGWWAAQPVAVRTVGSALTFVGLITTGLLIVVGEHHGYAVAQDILFGLRSPHGNETAPGTGVAGSLLSLIGYLLVPATVGASAGIVAQYIIAKRVHSDRKSRLTERLHRDSGHSDEHSVQ